MGLRATLLRYVEKIVDKKSGYGHMCLNALGHDENLTWMIVEGRTLNGDSHMGNAPCELLETLKTLME